MSDLVLNKCQGCCHPHLTTHLLMPPPWGLLQPGGFKGSNVETGADLFSVSLFTDDTIVLRNSPHLDDTALLGWLLLVTVVCDVTCSVCDMRWNCRGGRTVCGRRSSGPQGGCQVPLPKSHLSGPVFHDYPGAVCVSKE